MAIQVQIHRVMVLIATQTRQTPGQVEQTVDRLLAARLDSELRGTGEVSSDARHLGVTEVEIESPPTASSEANSREWNRAYDQWHEDHWPQLADYDNNGEKIRPRNLTVLELHQLRWCNHCVEQVGVEAICPTCKQPSVPMP